MSGPVVKTVFCFQSSIFLFKERVNANWSTVLGENLKRLANGLIQLGFVYSIIIEGLDKI
jgi:hypothetical protein